MTEKGFLIELFNDLYDVFYIQSILDIHSKIIEIQKKIQKKILDGLK